MVPKNWSSHTSSSSYAGICKMFRGAGFHASVVTFLVPTIVAYTGVTPPNTYELPEISSDELHHLGTANISKKWNITLCALVRNELPYLLEWIEFHRIQGVDHFVLYDDEGEDDITLLPSLYAAEGNPNMVEILPATFFTKNLLNSHQDDHYFFTQGSALSHCHVHYTNNSSWMLFIDPDEFIFSSRFGTIAGFLEAYGPYTDARIVNASQPVSQFYAEAARYGTSGLVNEFQVELERDTSGKLTVLYQPVNGSSDAFPLITELNRNRAPHEELDANFNETYAAVCKAKEEEYNRTVGDGEKICTHANGKSIFKPERCRGPFVHYCEDEQSLAYSPLMEDLRVSHFAWRTAEHVAKMKDDWNEVKKAAFALDSTWFSRVDDAATRSYIAELRQALARFSTRVMTKKGTESPTRGWFF